jgi:hypothetical protein
MEVLLQFFVLKEPDQKDGGEQKARIDIPFLDGDLDHLMQDKEKEIEKKTPPAHLHQTEQGDHQ